MQELIELFIDFVLHMDKHLADIVAQYHFWTYLILFLIIFCETGLVITPFLPGDSLLFATGAIAALDGSPLSIYLIIPLLIVAAIAGDSLNYSIGKYLGVKVYEKDYRFIKKKYLLKTKDFYEKWGGSTIIIARFMPIIRTFAPFVAGVGMMKFINFLKFNIIGAILWIAALTLAGYFFGTIPWVQSHFSTIVIMIIVISLIPPVVAFIKARFFGKD